MMYLPQEEKTALMFAAEEGHVAVARVLLERGADTVAKDDASRIGGAGGRAALGWVTHCTAHSAQLDSWPPDAKPHKGLTSGNVGPRKDNCHSLRGLECGWLSCVLATQGGSTALALAVSEGHANMVALLLDCGANVENQDEVSLVCGRGQAVASDGEAGWQAGMCRLGISIERAGKAQALHMDNLAWGACACTKQSLE